MNIVYIINNFLICSHHSVQTLQVKRIPALQLTV